METIETLPALCAGNPPVMPVMWNIGDFFKVNLSMTLNKNGDAGDLRRHDAYVTAMQCNLRLKQHGWLLARQIYVDCLLAWQAEMERRHQGTTGFVANGYNLGCHDGIPAEHAASVGPIGGWQAPGGPHAGATNLAVLRVVYVGL